MDEQKPFLFVKDSAAVLRQLKVGAHCLHYKENVETFSRIYFTSTLPQPLPAYLWYAARKCKVWGQFYFRKVFVGNRSMEFLRTCSEEKTVPRPKNFRSGNSLKVYSFFRCAG